MSTRTTIGVAVVNCRETELDAFQLTTRVDGLPSATPSTLAGDVEFRLSTPVPDVERMLLTISSVAVPPAVSGPIFALVPFFVDVASMTAASEPPCSLTELDDGEMVVPFPGELLALVWNDCDSLSMDAFSLLLLGDPGGGSRAAALTVPLRTPVPAGVDGDWLAIGVTVGSITATIQLLARLVVVGWPSV